MLLDSLPPSYSWSLNWESALPTLPQSSGSLGPGFQQEGWVDIGSAGFGGRAPSVLGAGRCSESEVPKELLSNGYENHRPPTRAIVQTVGGGAVSGEGAPVGREEAVAERT